MTVVFAKQRTRSLDFAEQNIKIVPTHEPKPYSTLSWEL